ncbi:MAG: oligosaccharide flippase family protein [Candidatus Gracilibacteria bacterium]|nr:oligosaccharide flippase family protein [Candidatus Gracilibacteria bacterium]
MIEQHATLTEKFLKKGFWLYLFSFIIAPLGYIIKIIISGELRVEEVGILYGIISLITLLSGFSDFGMTESLKKFIPQYVIEKRYDKVKTILFLTIIIQLFTSFLIFLLFYFGAEFIANTYFKDSVAIEVLKIFSIFFIGSNISQVISTFFLAIQDTFLNKITEFIRMIALLSFTIGIFVLNKSSIINYSYAWIFGLVIGIIFTYIFFHFKYYKKYLKGVKLSIDKELFKIVFKYALLVLLSTQASTILSQIDMQMIIYLLGNKDAGYYTNYLSIISIPIMIIGPIFMFLFPVFSEMYSKGEIEKIKLVKNIFVKIFLAIGIAFNTMFFVLGPAIAYTLFGEKFIDSGVILRYSVLLFIFNFLLQINGNILASIGKIKERLKIVSIGIIFNFITNIILIKLIGVYGAALATSFGWVLIWFLQEKVLGNEYKTNLDFKFIFNNLSIMTIVGTIIYFFSGNLVNISRVDSLIYLFIIGLIYFGLFVIINYKEFRFFILEIKRLRNDKHS